MLEKINYYKIFINCIEKCENFTYVRYNDGELDLIFNQELETVNLFLNDMQIYINNVNDESISYLPKVFI